MTICKIVVLRAAITKMNQVEKIRERQDLRCFTIYLLSWERSGCYFTLIFIGLQIISIYINPIQYKKSKKQNILKFL